MGERNLREAASVYAQLLQRPPAEPGQRRVRDRLEASIARDSTAHRRRPSWPRMIAFGTAAAVTSVVVVMVGLQQRRPAAPAAPSAAVGGFTVTETAGLGVSVLPGETITITTGHGRLRSGDVELEVSAGTRLRREARSVRVMRGAVHVTVVHQLPAASPVRVLVSGGAIEVMGTRFSVIEREDSGEVTLHEGAIRFVGLDGRIVWLAPGQSHHWPDMEAPDVLAPADAGDTADPVIPQPPAPRTAPARTRPAPAASGNLDALLSRLAVLRDRGLYEEAVRALGEARRGRLARTDDERLSYEIGALLTRQLEDRARACRHWAEHRRLFGTGRYALEIAQAMVDLHCRGNN